ncbi:MAG TPA: hypothetical protein VJ975_02155 [Candidatus Limnocylindria bacterium]|nr:hypothetical protein [Candidatus Limnocylindria bacterium]
MRELRLANGPLEAVVLPDAGARLHRIRAFGIDLLRTPDDSDAHLRDPFFWGAYVMAPWCNRLAAEPTRIGRQVADLPSNFPDGTAIHGQVASTPWTVDADGSTCRIVAGGDGWPWRYEVSMAISVAGPVLDVGLSLTNRSSEPMPGGLGIHPWWRRPVAIALRASRVFSSNTSAATRSVAATDAYDLRDLAEPASGLDATWTDLQQPTIELEWPEEGIHASVRLSADADHVAMATPRDVPAIAVEAQTHAPDGLGRLLRGEPGGLRMLQPDEAIRLGLRMTVRRL